LPYGDATDIPHSTTLHFAEDIYRHDQQLDNALDALLEEPYQVWTRRVHVDEIGSG
jgi:hypothetical protein